MSAGNEREFIDHLQNKERKEQAMKCPLLCKWTIEDTKGDVYTMDDCLKEECAWWNDRFGICSQVVDAYLKGLEDLRRENETIRKGG